MKQAKRQGMKQAKRQAMTQAKRQAMMRRWRPMLRSCLPLVLFLIPLAAQREVHVRRLAEVLVTHDDTVIHKSCRIKIPKGAVIRDSNGNGVLHVRARNIVVTFAEGSVLRGAPEGTAWDRLTGTGIRIHGHANVGIRNARVHGFKVGIHASKADGLGVVGCDVSDNFRQRLLSTPAAEVASDWLSPHDNDQHQWMKRYGAGIYVERSRQVEISRCRARRVQNGIILDRVTKGQVFDNDCSFLSGWGLALWRSNQNTITRNAFDFCIRGYSHGVYNRGQDSAGILMFEQCSNNVIAENSATHGGDGLFAFAGKQALGQRPEPEKGFRYRRRGNNDNLIVSNDLSYAAAHGLELTFSFGNRIYLNRLVGNAICGIWGGYSQDTDIGQNLFAQNGDRGYGLERGGINIEHGAGNVIHDNEFKNNRCGVHLWDDADEGLMKLPWAKVNHRGCVDNVIAHNRFEGDAVALHLRRAQKTIFARNKLVRVLKAVDAQKGSEPVQEAPPAVGKLPIYRPLGRTRPVGGRKQLRGRDKILLDEWGPWDHQSPLVRRAGEGSADEWQVFGVPGLTQRTPLRAKLVTGDVSLATRPASKTAPTSVRVTAKGSGVFPYAVQLDGPGFSRQVRGRLLALTWQVRVFSWQTDPRKDLAAWRREAKSALETTARSLDLHYGHGGPRQMKLSGEIQRRGPGTDRFGTLARTVVRLPRGRYRVTTRSDDGVRVIMNGELVIENWTHHGPTLDRGMFVLDKDSEVKIQVEHFELDGYAWLSFDLLPLRK